MARDRSNPSGFTGCSTPVPMTSNARDYNPPHKDPVCAGPGNPAPLQSPYNITTLETETVQAATLRQAPKAPEVK
jgi:hypothetical protein